MSADIQTLFVGKKFIYLSTVDSTNNYAANLLITSNVPDGTVIMADFQEEGRGQRGNSWSSDADQNLMFSIILFPKNLTPKDHFMLSKVVSLGIIQALQEDFNVEAKIKWPNDILIDGKKVSGILIENGLSGSKLSHSIVGIGFNVNQSDFPDDIPATSLSLSVDDAPVDRMEALSSLLYHIEKWYLQLNAGHLDRIDRAYFENLVHTANVNRVERDGGIVLDIDGKEEKYYHGEWKMPGITT